MIDFGLDKLALIGAVALVVIGPEKLPRVTRTVGHLLGRARRYMSDVQAEVNRSIELDELKRVKQQVESGSRAFEQTVHQSMAQTHSSLEGAWSELAADPAELGSMPVSPQYRHPGKKWRLKRSALPQWYRQRHGIPTRAQSGAARVARFRPVRRF